MSGLPDFEFHCLVVWVGLLLRNLQYLYFFSRGLKYFPVSCQEGKSMSAHVLGTRRDNGTGKGAVGSGSGALSASGMHQTHDYLIILLFESGMVSGPLVHGSSSESKPPVFFWDGGRANAQWSGIGVGFGDRAQMHHALVWGPTRAAV